jgi:hypothetical protein
MLKQKLGQHYSFRDHKLNYIRLIDSLTYFECKEMRVRLGLICNSFFICVLFKLIVSGTKYTHSYILHLFCYFKFKAIHDTLFILI